MSRTLRCAVSGFFLCSCLVAVSHPAKAAGDPALKCQADKLKEAGKYGARRLKEEARAVKNGEPPALAKPTAKFGEKWRKIETKGGLACPTRGDEETVGDEISACTDRVKSLLSGGAVNTCDTCGNGVIEEGEDCDLGDLDCGTCQGEGLEYGPLRCGPDCLFDTSGCGNGWRFEDTGLTIIDHQTGLEWQKQDEGDGLTDKDNTYTWTGDGLGGTAANGTVYTEFLAGLNDSGAPGGCYAGHCDWRLPTSAGCCGQETGEPAEMSSIHDVTLGLCAGDTGACIDPIFGPTAEAGYWTATTVSANLVNAWHMHFHCFGNPCYEGVGIEKDDLQHARAVRSSCP